MGRSRSNSMDQAVNELAELQRQLEVYRRQIKSLEEDIGDKDKIIVSQSRENKGIKSNLNACKEDNGRLRRQIKEYEGDLASKKTQLTNLEGALVAKNKKVEALEQSLERFQSHNCRLKSAVQNEQIAKDVLKQQAKLDAQHFQMERTQLTKTQSTLKAVEYELEASQKHRTNEVEMAKRIAKLEHDFRQLAGELLKEQVENARLYQEIDTVSKTGHRDHDGTDKEAEKQGPYTTDQVKVLRKAVLRYSHQVRTLQDSLQNKESTIQRLYQVLGRKRRGEIHEMVSIDKHGGKTIGAASSEQAPN